jgi:hypothetical protein
MRICLLIAAAMLLFSVRNIVAQNLDVIKERRAAMSAIGEAGLANFKMMRGETPFELEKAQTRLKTLQDQAANFKALFPEDSRTGGETDAAPRIWRSNAPMIGSCLQPARPLPSPRTNRASRAPIRQWPRAVVVVTTTKTASRHA